PQPAIEQATEQPTHRLRAHQLADRQRLAVQAQIDEDRKERAHYPLAQRHDRHRPQHHSQRSLVRDHSQAGRPLAHHVAAPTSAPARRGPAPPAGRAAAPGGAPAPTTTGPTAAADAEGGPSAGAPARLRPIAEAAMSPISSAASRNESASAATMPDSPKKPATT